MNEEQNALLIRLDQLAAAQRWDELIEAIGAAQAVGLTRSIHSVPLSFLAQEAIAGRGAAAAAQAKIILTEATLALEQGDPDSAKRALARALAVEHLPPAAARRIQGQVERLETQVFVATTALNDDGERATGPQLDSLLADLQASRPTMYRMLALCAVPRWLDEEIIAVLRQKEDGRNHEVLERINAYSFIYPWDTDLYTMSEDARQYFLAAWHAETEAYRDVNSQLANHFAARLTTEAPRDPAIKERLRQAQLYHTFLADPAAGAALLGRYFQAAEDAHQLVAARQYILVLQTLRGQIPPAYYAYVEYAEGWFHHLRGNERAAAVLFDELAQRTDLPPDLAARVQRGQAAVLVEEGEWTQALAGFQAARDTFTALGATDEVAETMSQIGGAYLSIAADAMGEYDPLMPEYTGHTGALALGALLVRLPLILYLINKLGIFWPLPNLMRLGQGLDWVIARLFSDAILWLRQAEAAYAELGDSAGVNRTREALGRLHWVLNDPLRAKAFLEPLRDEYVSGSFAYARVEQELAETYLAQGHDAAAQPLLQEALTVFQQVGHQQRIAQCHNRLGSIAAARQEPSAAAMHYARALDAWQRTENEIRVTQMGHRLDALKAEGELTETAAIAATEARVGVATQTYATRYIHPFSLYYQRTSIILFALLIGLLSLINVQLRPTIDLISKLTLDASQLERMTYTLDQSVRLAAKVDIEPSPWVIFLVSALTFLLFIFIYAGGGAYLLRRIPLRSLQENFTERVEIDASGIRQISKQASVAIAWDAVHQPVYSTRSFCKNPIDLFSTIALPAAQARIEIDGLVQGYENVEQAIRARFAGSPAGEKDLSVNFLCRGWGLVFLASMALQVLFLIAALIGEEWLRNTLLVLHYTYADLWNIIEVGIALPLLYWLIIQPARYRLYARGQRWNLGMLLGVAFVAFLISLSTIQMGRPAILAGVITLFTGAFVLYDHLRFERDMAEWAPPTDRRRRSLNILLIAGTLALMVAALLSLVTELRSFHHQAVGYEQFLQTQQTVEEAGPALRSEITAAQRRVVQERIALNEMLNQPEAWIAERSQDPKISEVDARELLPVERSNTEMRLAQAETELEQRQLALDEVMAGFQSTKEAFERSIEIKRDAVPYRFLIITHAYLREHKEARAAYEEMQERGLVRPSADSELLTQVLHQGGLDISAPEDKRETWRDALKFYDERLDDPTLSATERAELEHLRAALLVSLAGVSPTERETLLNEAEAIFAARVTQLARRHAGNAPASDLANAYAELGTAYLLRGLDSPGADDERSAIFVSAQSAFEQSIKADPAVLAAYNGLAWSLFEQSRLAPGNCIAGFERPGEAPGYIALIEHAVDAFDDALENPAAETLAEGADERWIKTSASYYRTRAQLHYILAQCDDDAAGYDRGEYLRLAIADYLQATALDERAGWIDRLGDIRVEYARLLKESERPAAATLQHQLAARDYANVIALDQGYFGTRKKLFELLRDDLQVDSPSVQAISLIASAAQRSDDPAFFLAFAQEEIARERGVTALAAAAISRTLALDPANREAIMLAGPLYEQWARPAQTEAERATRYQRAFDAVEQALEIAPDDANLWLTRGRVNLGLGNTEAAIADFKQAQALAPQDPAVMYALGLAHLLNGAVDRANDLYEQANTQAVTQPPPNVKSTYAQAISDLLITSGRDLQSRAALAITIAETSLAQRNVAADDGEALVEMARAASSDGDYEAAIPIWTKAIQLTPEENRNWQSMRSALILSPNFSQIQSGEAVLTLLMGLFDGSENEVLHEVAQIDLDEGVYGLAAAAMERAIALDARDEGAYARLAETYYRWGERWDLDNRLEEAVDVVNRAQAAGIEQAEVYHYASLALRSLRRFDEAIAAGQAAIDLDPTYRTAFSRLGWTAYLAGEYDLSTAVTKQAIDLDPSDPREHFNLGIARAASGDVGGAKAAYEAGLAAADLPENAARRTARLNEALGDLRAIEADPAGLADDLISRLEAALDSSE